jgi:cobyrinic acid a,c-diamide synthase
MDSVRRASKAGLPIYAECGGLMYLSRSVRQAGEVHQMAGVFPLDLEMHKRPVGHGYTELVIDSENPFLPVGTCLRGHEFHYSGVVGTVASTTCANVKVGVGLGSGRDGLRRENTMALYTHLHADGVKGWAGGFVGAASRYRAGRDSSTTGETDHTDEESDPGTTTIRATNVA